MEFTTFNLSEYPNNIPMMIMAAVSHKMLKIMKKSAFLDIVFCYCAFLSIAADGA